MAPGRYVKEIFKHFKNDRTEDPDLLPETPDSYRSLETVEKAEIQALEIVNDVFRMVKLGISNPKRWSRLYMVVAQRHEVRLLQLRERVYIAVSLDDWEELARLKLETPEKLWSIWGFILGLNERATQRCRPRLLEVLPALNGVMFPGAAAVRDRRDAIDFRPEAGSRESFLQAQRGEALIAVVCTPYERMKEIDMKALGDELNCVEAGSWREEISLEPARGVNYGRWEGQYGGWRPLHFCVGNTYAKKTSLPAMKQLIDARADPSLPDASGASPLHLAAFKGHVKAVDLLLEKGSYVEGGDKFGITPFLCAARARNAEIVRRLVKWVLPDEMSPPLFDTENERNAQLYSVANGNKMHLSISKGNWSDVEFLIRRGGGDCYNLADVNHADAMGRRSLHVAVASINAEPKCVETLRALVAHRADVDGRVSESSETALHVAARLGRAEAARSLLRLRAHPGLADVRGRTPLMLAAAAPGQVCSCGYVFVDNATHCQNFKCNAARLSRKPPEYNGSLKNEPLEWGEISDVLQWSGTGDIPGHGPKPRKVKGAAADTVNTLFSKGFLDQLPPMRKRRSPEEGMATEDDNEDDVSDGPGDADSELSPKNGKAGLGGEVRAPITTPADTVRARANAIIALGFDDQTIMDSGGRFNRGDRMQLFAQLFMRPKGASKHVPVKPVERRLRLLWSQLTSPLIAMQVEKTISPRHAELLEYLLACVFGNRGQTFAALCRTGLGAKVYVVPTWDELSSTLRQYEDLDDRVEALRLLCFRGSKPRRQKWVGAVWSPDEYPREPDYAPWDAFEYVDQDTADVINTRDGTYFLTAAKEEAFKGNSFDQFDAEFKHEIVSANIPPPSRGDMFQLTNRLIVDEACGQWAITREDCWDRLRCIGEYLLCPLLSEALEALRGDGDMMEAAANHRELLRYTVSQMDVVHKFLEQPRQCYKEEWTEVRNLALRVLNDQLVAEISKLDITPPLVDDDTWGPDGTAVKAGQESCLPKDDVHWLKQRHSTLSYVELLRCGAITCAADFCDIVLALSAKCQQEGLADCFWRAAFCLLLWGRARSLVDAFKSALKRRLPSQGVILLGPILKPRSAVLWAATQSADEAHDESPAAEVSQRVREACQDSSNLASRSRPQSQAAPTRKAEVVELRRPQSQAAPTRKDEVAHQAKKAPPKQAACPPQNLPRGFTDILKAEIVCKTEEAMMETLENLLDPDEPGTEDERKTLDDCSDFVVLQVDSDFHKQPGEVFPRACSVRLLCKVGCKKQVRGENLRQLVEVELVFPATHEARWLAGAIGVEPREIVPVERRRVAKKKKGRFSIG